MAFHCKCVDDKIPLVKQQPLRGINQVSFRYRRGNRYAAHRWVWQKIIGTVRSLPIGALYPKLGGTAPWGYFE